MSINSVNLVGRLTADPELRYTPTGVAVANFTVASNRPFKNAQGEQEADFIRCVAWRAQAENVANYMRKGSQVGVTGRIQTGHYDDADGKRVYTTDIVAESVAFLEPKGNNNTSSAQTKQPTNNLSEGAPIDIQEDDLPF